jgi:hypothetical protein
MIGRIPRKRYIIISILLLSLLITSCGPRRIGYGVLLWSTDEQKIETGELVEIIEESEIRNTYSIKISELDEPIEVDKWRVSMFKDIETAQGKVKNFSEYRYLFAKADQNALPVREEPDRLSKRVYKLREDEIIKVLENSIEFSNEDGLEGSWYKVLTPEGVVGYCFDFHLTLFDIKDGDLHVKEVEEDELLQGFLSHPWRPIEFLDLILNKTIDLDVIKPEIGLFPQPEEKTLTLVTPDYTLNFDYSDIKKIGSKKYIFEGNSLQLLIINEYSASIQYNYDGNLFSVAYRNIVQDIRTVIEREQDRRLMALGAFLERGTTFRSEAYGQINMMSDWSFTWFGYERLVPRVIGNSAGFTGHVSFHLFQSVDITYQYDGIISFHFENTPEDVYVHFFYEFTGMDVRLTYIPLEHIEQHLVKSEMLNPIVMVFTFF